MMACSIAQGHKVPTSHVGYVGDVKSNLPEGYGVYTYPNSFFRYEGEWNKGVKDGIGNLKMKDGSYYKGQFLNGEIDGVGLRFWVHNGNTYDGEFEKGELCGWGVMKYGNGNAYEGSWVDNMQHGEGILTEVDGSVYNGSFYCHKRHGEGKQKYSDLGVYNGGWINNMRHGHGIMIFKDGSIYEGQWRADEMHGEGSFTHSSQITYNGMWNNGRPIDEPASICIVSDQEIIVEQNEMPFSIHVECRSLDNEATSESGRSLQVTAGVHPTEKIHLTPSKISANSTRNDTSSSGHSIKYDSNLSANSKRNDTVQVVGRRETPFGFDVDPYPVYTKVIINDLTDVEEIQSASTGSPRSVGTPFKDDILQTPTTPTTPIKSLRDAVKVLNENRADSPSHFEYIPVTIQRTIDGKASFLNLVLPTMDTNNSTSIISVSPENTEVKTSNRKKVDSSKTGEESGSGSRRKKMTKTKEDKNEELSYDPPYKPGDYVIIIEDITESPFLDVLLDPVYILVKVPQHVKKSKSTKAANKMDK